MVEDCLSQLGKAVDQFANCCELADSTKVLADLILDSQALSWLELRELNHALLQPIH